MKAKVMKHQAPFLCRPFTKEALTSAKPLIQMWCNKPEGIFYFRFNYWQVFGTPDARWQAAYVDAVPRRFCR